MWCCADLNFDVIRHQFSQYPDQKGVGQRAAHLVIVSARCVTVQNTTLADAESDQSKANHKPQAQERDRLDADDLLTLFLCFVFSIQRLDMCLEVETI